MKINETIKKYRKSLNLSQHEFGRLCGLRQTVVCGLETGHRSPSWRTLMKIAKGTGGRITFAIEKK